MEERLEFLQADVMEIVGVRKSTLEQWLHGRYIKASIQQAEEKHIAALVTLYDRYGLAVPENEWPGAVPTFDSLTEACAAAAQAEIDNAALYDQLLSLVDNPDIIRAFTALQQASQTKHLPAFEACAH